MCGHMPDGGFELDTSQGAVTATRVVVATGGLPVPKIGASDWGLRLAKRFEHAIVEPRPALVPLTFNSDDWGPFAALAGLSLPVEVCCGSGKARGRFLEDLLFTHRGLSGPAILQISSYRTAGDQPLQINLAPEMQLDKELIEAKAMSRRQLGNEFACSTAATPGCCVAGTRRLGRSPPYCPNAGTPTCCAWAATFMTGS